MRGPPRIRLPLSAIAFEPVILSAAMLLKFAVEDKAPAWLAVDDVVSKATLSVPAFSLPLKCGGTYGDGHFVLMVCQVERQRGDGNMV